MAQETSQRSNGFHELFLRYEGNPILTAADWPYSVNTVFNPAAVEFNGKVLLLVRVEDRRGFSHLATAISPNGRDSWIISPSPVLAPSSEYPQETWGVEDPRISYVKELHKFAVVYTGYSVSGPVVRLAMTEDFVHFERKGSIMPPEDKDAALFPCRFNERWMLIHRPIEHGAHVWISSSDNLKDWGRHKILLPTRPGSWWDSCKVGLCTPPLETKEGWLFIYHGVKQTAAGFIYRLGLALLDHDDPSKVLRRSSGWIFGPKESYEKIGDVSDVVFPCGWIHNQGSDELSMYYGAADTCVCLATARLDDVLEYIMRCEPPEEYL